MSTDIPTSAATTVVEKLVVAKLMAYMQEQIYEQLQIERQERLGKRNLNKEPYLGEEPSPEGFVQAVAKLLDKEADRALLHHIFMKWMRQYKDDVNPVFCDHYYRYNKVIKRKKLLRGARFSHLVEAGLLRKVRNAHIGDTPDLYEPTERLLLLFNKHFPKTYKDFINLKTVNPLTGRRCSPPRHQLKRAPDCVKKFAKSIGGAQVDLEAIWNLHQQEHTRWEKALAKHPKDRTPEETTGVGRYRTNQYNLMGIRINRFVQLPGGDVLLRQAWGYTYPGRLKPLHGGFLNLSRDYREVGLANCGKVQWVHDLVAAQVNILLEMAEDREIKLPHLEQYANNTTWRQKYADAVGFGCTAKIIKTAVLSLVMQVAAPHPYLIKKMRQKRKSISKFSFVMAFIGLGGIEAYERAYEVLQPIIKETKMMADILYREYRRNAKPYKGQLRTENAIGMKKAFWKKDGSLMEGYTVRMVKRELNAFLLQGREQQIIHTIAKEQHILGYEHDGFISEGKVEWQKGRIRIEGKPKGIESQTRAK